MLERQCSSFAPGDSLLVDPSKQSSRVIEEPLVERVHVESGLVAEQKSPTCSGCGSVLQCEDLHKQGYIPWKKLQGAVESVVNRNVVNDEVDRADEGERDEEEGEVKSVVENSTGESSLTPQLTCMRCFSLKHYNTALNITLKADDYLRHLSHLRDKRALILLVVDVIDFPGSLFPSLHTLVSLSSRVLVVANKIDLLPKSVDRNIWNRLETLILDECENSSLKGCSVSGVVFTSVKSGEGLEKLATSVQEYWGNRGDVYLLGCTNVGKSSLFNHLLQSLCGASPGQLDVDCGVGAPAATISRWPGTTLGLLSFPIMSVGKRKRLLARQLRVREMELRGREGEVMHTLTPSLEEDVQGTRAESEAPQNRFWLHDTPGAINDAQVLVH